MNEATGVLTPPAPAASATAAPSPAPVVTPPPAAAPVVIPIVQAPAPTPAAPVNGAPEKYSLKPPQGVASLDPAVVEKLSSFSKERGLTNDQAQAVLERDYARDKADLESHMSALKEQNEVSWIKEARNDPEFGGTEENFKANAESAKRVFDYADADGSFRKLLKEAHLSNLPQLLKFAARIGKLMKQDTLGTPPPGATKQPHKDPGKRLEQAYAEQMRPKSAM